MKQLLPSLLYSYFVLIDHLSCAKLQPEAIRHIKQLNASIPQEHHRNEKRDKEYDHEAFLGEEAKIFDQLTPEESQRRLSLIVDKIDRDHDGNITLAELKDWIKYTQTRYLAKSVDDQWRMHNLGEKDKITWDEYRKTIYGFNDDHEAHHIDNEAEAGGYSFKMMLDRDKRRWNAADEDGDKALTREEFAAFLHPEEVERMKDIVVIETMDDIDKNKDGKISLREYIADMYHEEIEEGDEMPEWVQNENIQFKTYRDKDGDGFMNDKEVRDWILPEGFDHADAEARHLMYESDSDADQQLTKQEILDKYDLFVGSQATDFGEALTRHDEF